MSVRKKKSAFHGNATPASDRSSSSLRAPRIAGAVLVAVTLAVFGSTLRNGFVSYDDEQYVLRNPHVRGGLSFGNVAWAFTATEAASWHPLTWISHMADVSLYGLSPAGHHATSVLLHAANALLVFLLLRRATGRLPESLAAAALFALHPLRVESVAWTADRRDVLSLFFGLLAIGAWGRWTRSSAKGRGGYAASLVLFAASLMAGATLVMLPLLLLVLDFWPLRRTATEPRRRLVLEKAPFAVLSVAAAVLLWDAQQTPTTAAARALPFGFRVENAFVLVVRYLGKTLWPSHLAVLYPRQFSDLLWRPPLQALGIAGALILVAAITLAVVRVRRSRPYLLAGWAWFLLALTPALGVFQTSVQPIADRCTLAASIGLAVAIVWGVSDLLAPRVPVRLLAGIAAVGLAVLAIVSIRQVSVWRDSLALYSHAVAVTEPNETMLVDLGNELVRRGRTEEAAARFDDALKIDSKSKDALYALGSLELSQGRFPEARSNFSQAVLYHPTFAEAAVQIASSFVREKRPGEAFAAVRQALEIRPGFADAFYVWGAALEVQGDEHGAEEKYRAAIAAHPEYAEAHQNLGELLAARGRFIEAAAEFEAALRANPDFGEARQSLDALQQRRPS